MKRILLFNKFDLVNENVIVPQEYLEFLDMLKEMEVPIDLYGTGKYKTVGHLWQEIKEGETKLEIEDGNLVRRVEFVGARILYKRCSMYLQSLLIGTF